MAEFETLAAGPVEIHRIGGVARDNICIVSSENLPRLVRGLGEEKWKALVDGAQAIELTTSWWIIDPVADRRTPGRVSIGEAIRQARSFKTTEIDGDILAFCRQRTLISGRADLVAVYGLVWRAGVAARFRGLVKEILADAGSPGIEAWDDGTRVAFDTKMFNQRGRVFFEGWILSGAGHLASITVEMPDGQRIPASGVLRKDRRDVLSGFGFGASVSSENRQPGIACYFDLGVAAKSDLISLVLQFEKPDTPERRYPLALSDASERDYTREIARTLVQDVDARLETVETAGRMLYDFRRDFQKARSIPMETVANGLEREGRDAAIVFYLRTRADLFGLQCSLVPWPALDDRIEVVVVASRSVPRYDVEKVVEGILNPSGVASRVISVGRTIPPSKAFNLAAKETQARSCLFIPEGYVSFDLANLLSSDRTIRLAIGAPHGQRLLGLVPDWRRFDGSPMDEVADVGEELSGLSFSWRSAIQQRVATSRGVLRDNGPIMIERAAFIADGGFFEGFFHDGYYVGDLIRRLGERQGFEPFPLCTFFNYAVAPPREKAIEFVWNLLIAMCQRDGQMQESDLAWSA